MNIGKREQIVIGSISAILLIVVLHMLIFAPSAARFKEAKGARDAMANQIAGLSTIQNPKILADFETKTNDYLKKLEEGTTRLKMDEPACFILPKLADVKERPGEAPLPPYAATPTPAPMAGPTPTPSPDDIRRKEIHDELLKAKLPAQLDLVMAEITKLREATRGRGLQVSFLGNNRQGWNVPTQLPANMQTSLLWDQVKSIASKRTSMDKMNKTIAQYPLLMTSYMQDLRQLGIDLYFSENLVKYGDFVPIIQRLCLADLILQKLNASPTPVIIENAPLTREKLLHYLFIDLPIEPLDGLNESKIYFLYEALRNLNYLIEMAQKQGVKDITAVTLRGFAYVREMSKLDDPTEFISDPEKLIDDEIDDKMALAAAAAANPGAIDPNAAAGAAGMAPGGMMADPYAGGMGAYSDPYMMGMQSGPTLNLYATTPQPGDLGIAIPIRVSFVAPNTNGFTYLYEILRDKPMAEVHRLILRSTSVYNPMIPLTVQPNPTSTDVEMTATMLFVPKLFNTMDTVRVLIDELHAKANGATTATTATAAPTPVP